MGSELVRSGNPINEHQRQIHSNTIQNYTLQDKLKYNIKIYLEKAKIVSRFNLDLK